MNLIFDIYVVKFIDLNSENYLFSSCFNGMNFFSDENVYFWVYFDFYVRFYCQ